MDRTTPYIFERGDVALTIGANVFWEMVGGKGFTPNENAETALALEVAECMNATMPIDTKTEIRVDGHHQILFKCLNIIAETMVSSDPPPLKWSALEYGF